jgi:hypothetical protein
MCLTERKIVVDFIQKEVHSLYEEYKNVERDLLLRRKYEFALYRELDNL